MKDLDMTTKKTSHTYVAKLLYLRNRAMSYLSLRKIFAEVKLDDEHLELYPFCGKLFGYQWHDAKSRIVNSIENFGQGNHYTML